MKRCAAPDCNKDVRRNRWCSASVRLPKRSRLGVGISLQAWRADIRVAVIIGENHKDVRFSGSSVSGPQCGQQSQQQSGEKGE